MRDQFTVSGITGATAATADKPIASLWNPSTAKRIVATDIWVFATTAGGIDRPKLRRISAKGTITTEVAVVAGNGHDGDLVAPVSGALLDLVFSADPTFVVGECHQGFKPATIGAGFMFRADPGIEIPEGGGLCLCTGSALAFPVSIVTFSYFE
jgi:hypothetical protein